MNWSRRTAISGIADGEDARRQQHGVDGTPALPTAKVATGMPAGICTVASRASRPPRAEAARGTPMTGRLVRAGHHARQVGGHPGTADRRPQ
jgi:hypothetical protein